jgi:hypothetical protein
METNGLRIDYGDKRVGITIIFQLLIVADILLN